MIKRFAAAVTLLVLALTARGEARSHPLFATRAEIFAATSNYPPPSFPTALVGMNLNGANIQNVLCNPNADLVTCTLAVTTTGSTGSPGYTRIQDGTGTNLATVQSNGQLVTTIEGSTGNQVVVATYSNSDSNSGSLPDLLTGAFNLIYNGATWDRQRKDTYTAGPIWATPGGSLNAVIAAATTGPTVIKGTPGRIARMLVTVAGTASETCFDNASTATGTIIGITPTTSAVGTVIALDLPAASGITCSGGAGSPGLTISYF